MTKQEKLNKKLIVAVMHAYSHEIPALLAAGANPNQTVIYQGITTPLLLQVMRVMPALLDDFLEYGVRVDVQNGAGIGPLHLARDAEMVAKLIKAGASVRITNKGGATPLHVAGSQEMAELMVEAGADPHALCGDGMLPWEKIEQFTEFAAAEGATSDQLNRYRGGANWLRSRVEGAELIDLTPDVGMTPEEQTAKAQGGRI